jgi:pimeloyl-ACP methyl ester carboxylesterase
MPVLVLVGEEDVITPPAGAAEMAASVEHARLRTIPRAGHVVNLESPEAVDQALREFLEGIG